MKWMQLHMIGLQVMILEFSLVNQNLLLFRSCSRALYFTKENRINIYRRKELHIVLPTVSLLSEELE